MPLFQEQLLRMAMIASGFTGGEAEELRRAFGFKRSERLMRDVEVKLRRGMEKNGITGETQDTIVKSITSFALYGFPESHAASFALIAYASAYLKCHYLAAFTAAILNNQPMGFYHPATLVKDAQRHGLRIRPIDVTQSDWLCTLEKIDGKLVMRLGLRYVKGLREETGREIARQRGVDTISLHRRFEIARAGAAKIGAHGAGGSRRTEFRRRETRDFTAAMRCGRSNAFRARPARCWKPAKKSKTPPIPPALAFSPLEPMTSEDRLVADFRNTGMTVGPHPLSYHREHLKRSGVLSAVELQHVSDGTHVRVAGSVIARQRPGTAKGFVFLSMEDETGIANAIITPQLFQKEHVTIVHQQFLLVEGRLQNQDNVISVKAERIRGAGFDAGGNHVARFSLIAFSVFFRPAEAICSRVGAQSRPQTRPCPFEKKHFGWIPSKCLCRSSAFCQNASTWRSSVRASPGFPLRARSPSAARPWPSWKPRPSAGAQVRATAAWC